VVVVVEVLVVGAAVGLLGELPHLQVDRHSSSLEMPWSINSQPNMSLRKRSSKQSA
jgi:hypothetical protein